MHLFAIACEMCHLIILSIGNSFAAINICLVIYGILLLPVTENGGGALIWIGAVAQMLLTVLRVSDLVYLPFSEEMLNPSLMMGPVGNFIAAIGFAVYDVQYHGSNEHGKLSDTLCVFVVLFLLFLCSALSSPLHELRMFHSPVVMSCMCYC